MENKINLDDPLDKVLEIPLVKKIFDYGFWFVCLPGCILIIWMFYIIFSNLF